MGRREEKIPILDNGARLETTRTFSISLAFAFKTRRLFATCLCLEVSKQRELVGLRKYDVYLGRRGDAVHPPPQSAECIYTAGRARMTSLSGVQPQTF